MIKRIRIVIFVAATLLHADLSARAGEKVDLLLVLAADVSYSVDLSQFRLQRDGYANAIVNPQVLKAIRSGKIGRIAVCFVEWSGETWQELVVDWTLIGDAETARQFSDKIRKAPKPFAERTSISGAIYFAMTQLERAPFESRRRTIDISGNGDNNAGRSVTVARDEASAKGVTINGLVILANVSSANTDHTSPPEGLEEYYRRNVIGGPGAFVMVSENVRSFGDALIKKLTSEIAQATPSRHARFFELGHRLHSGRGRPTNH
jgi:Protein of unknown function (DUF1194)